ncbi:transcriptional repressor p66-beta isoform X2 [Onthophagus taurus]|uniref:transcriptional repressor p66-beta isoform X2 n=1 Tax=Onthophagus taurus TaxID=166361 RepID=UPI000C208994|nr:transcriptional repressor p66-beta isoform X2 [Onthophagus taurus]
MEKMDVDEAVVDLSLSANRSGLTVTTNNPSSLPIVNNSTPISIVAPVSSSINNIGGGASNNITNSTSSFMSYPTGTTQSTVSITNRRVLRPRTEPRSYVESPDVVINGLDKPRTNGNLDYSSDSSEGEMPPLAPIKELSPSELRHRERGLRRLREELRVEEMKLVLLKKLKQSQQLKENVAVLPPNIPHSALPPTGLPSGLSITPTTVKVPTNKTTPLPQAAHSRNLHKTGQNAVPPPLRGQPPPSNRNSLHVTAVTGSPHNRTSLSVPQPPQRSSLGRPPNFPVGIKDLSPSVTITPAPPQPTKSGNGLDNKNIGASNNMPQTTPIPEQERQRDQETPAQRQAAAKLALRKQLEKTLLQIPPPKPPPPEMHFIPNPSNTEFIYLVGLEHVVDFLTKETKMPPAPQPFSCSQCGCDFTPVWKWEMRGNKSRGKDPSKVICEQCVTTNVKKALKAEHTNRLKTAFVKALQQEQEIEQRLAQNGVFTSSSPAPSPVTPEASVPKSVTPTPTPRHAATPPAPPSTQQTPPPSRSSHSSAQDKLNISNAATMQALQQQILRTLQAGGPQAQMLSFAPFLYPYQLAMAQAAAGKGMNPSLSDMQRAAELQRQYLLDMIPPQSGQRHNWKT